jgi:Uma2 family endonuclease
VATKEKLTLEQFLALPETKPGSEFIDGEAVQKPMPTIAHGIIQRLLSFVFTLYLQSHPIGEAGTEWRCVFGPPGTERAPLPDFTFVLTEHMERDTLHGPHRGPPDLAVEILSPDDRPGSVADKILYYLLNGVRLVWLIDPDRRIVQVFTLDRVMRELTEDDTLDGGDVIPGFAVTVRDILPPARPLWGQAAQ